MSKKITSLFNFKKLQKFSSALMLPIAILPAADFSHRDFI